MENVSQFLTGYSQVNAANDETNQNFVATLQYYCSTQCNPLLGDLTNTAFRIPSLGFPRLAGENSSGNSFKCLISQRLILETDNSEPY